MYDLEALILDYQQGKQFDFVFFWGHQAREDGQITASCFSQWWSATFEVDGITYTSAEHYMMAEKAKLFGDEAIHEAIINAPSPAHAKKLGREVQGFERVTWDAHKVEIVITGNRHKFAQNSALKEFLLSTNSRILVEASPVDKIWGIGLAKEDDDSMIPTRWQGANLLGFALMEVRKQLSV